MITFICVSCVQSHKGKSENTQLMENIIMYYQESLPDVTKDTSLSTNLYEELCMEIIEKYGQHFTKEAQDTLIIEVLGPSYQYLSQFSLPITITESKSEISDSETVTLHFKDSLKEEGQFVFHIQNQDDGRISFIKIDALNIDFDK